jgi:hypothetical protein
MLHRELKWDPASWDESDSDPFTERVEELIMAVSTRNRTKSHMGGEDQSQAN